MRNIFPSLLLLLALLFTGTLVQTLNAQQDTVIFYLDTLGITEDANDPGLYTIPVRVFNYDTVSGFDITFVLDSPGISYEDDGYTNSIFSSPGLLGNVTGNSLRLIYLDLSSITGESLPDDTRVFDLYVRIDGEPGDCASILIEGLEVTKEDPTTAVPSRGVGGEVCIIDFVEVSGQVVGPEGTPFGNVELELVTADSTYRDTTSLTGQYSFAEVPTGEPFRIQPTSKLDVVTRAERLAGVNVGDIVLAQSYLLGLMTLPPAQIVAADADADQAVSLVDLTTLAAYVLFRIDDLPGDGIYRFWPSSFEFADPTNPWSAPIPMMISSDGIIEDTPGQDFIGVKRGDVNSSSY